MFSIDEPSATIRGINRPIPDNYKHHHADAAEIKDGVRALTFKERSYLQSFPDGFQFPGAKTNVELAIGNAVPQHWLTMWRDIFLTTKRPIQSNEVNDVLLHAC